MATVSERITHLPDQLLDLAFNTPELSLAQKLQTFEDKRVQLGKLAASAWRPDHSDVAEAARAYTFIATLPSLELVIQSAPQGMSSAHEVAGRYQDFSQTVLSPSFLGGIHKRGHSDPGFRGLFNGRLAEAGVLAVIWHGVERGLWSERTYALPASRTEGEKRLKEGHNLATNIIVRESGTKRRQPIQVITQFGTSKRLDDYHYDVTLVTVEDLVGKRRDRKFNLAERLLAMVAENDERRLTGAAEHIHKLLARTSGAGRTRTVTPSRRPTQYKRSRQPRRGKH